MKNLRKDTQVFHMNRRTESLYIKDVIHLAKQ